MLVKYIQDHLGLTCKLFPVLLEINRQKKKKNATKYLVIITKLRQTYDKSMLMFLTKKPALRFVKEIYIKPIRKLTWLLNLLEITA